MQIATKHGLGSFLRRFRTPSRLQRGDVVAAHLREALSEGGVTFVKLGQTLATRADLLPEPFVRELSALHSDVSPQPWSLVEEQITAQLGRPIDEVFDSVDHEPLAAASVAQVHSAVLLSGERVVIKIQRAAAAQPPQQKARVSPSNASRTAASASTGSPQWKHATHAAAGPAPRTTASITRFRAPPGARTPPVARAASARRCAMRRPSAAGARSSRGRGRSRLRHASRKCCTAE